MNPILSMRHIHKTFPGVVALDDVHFELRKGEVHVLLGENGAGKSTLMKILSGAYQKTAGQIFLDGQETEIKSPRHAQELGISTIYQELNLIPKLSVGENIFLGREPVLGSGLIDHKNLFQKSQELLNNLGVGIDAHTPVGELGVAQQQMVEVAKALSLDARILIMDEPTSALAEHEIRELFLTMRRLKSRGVAIIYISHRLEELFEIGDRVTVLRDGKFVGQRDIDKVSKSQLIQMMVNRELKEQYPRSKSKIGEEVLRVESLSVNEVLEDVSFSLRKGEILGIAGLLGAGRTELARAIFGVEHPNSGDIFVKGENRKIPSPRTAINSGIGFLTEDRKSQGLILNLSVKQNVSLPSLTRLSRAGIIRIKREEEEVRKFIEDLKIRTPGSEQKVMFLSGGNQQKVVLSKWLYCQVDILIFDEPTRGIDVGAKVEIYQLMNQLTDRGAAIIMISSELPEILGMSDRILVMHQGRITGEFTQVEASQEKILQCALGEHQA